MSTGSRTILITRWRPAGQTTFDLVREFVQELPRSSATDAWHRAVELARSTELDIDREPRVKLSPSDNLKADHPFFWAGYLLVDRENGGGEAKAELKKEAVPAKEAAPPKEAAPKAGEKGKEAVEPAKEAVPAKEDPPAKAALPVKKPAPGKPAANKGEKVKPK
jgi:hypothetical protein